MATNITNTYSGGSQDPASVRDAENSADNTAQIVNEKLDIEHVHVTDDPRQWSNIRKTSTLVMIVCATMVSFFGGNILNPAIKQVESDLRTTSGKFSLTISIFTVTQGILPPLWASISEIKGRKLVYIVTLAIALVGCVVAAEAKSIGVLIAMRAVQAVGTSSVVAIGAATLADIFDPFERGTKLGIYYAAPFIGSSLGPIIGGLLTQVSSWHVVFWFLGADILANLVVFVFFFRDTFRKERSLTYQRVLASRRSAAAKQSTVVVTVSGPVHELGDKSDGEDKVVTEVSVGPTGPTAEPEIALSFKDVNPFPPLLLVLKRPNNIAILLVSGLLYAFTISLTYTSARLLLNMYNYNALKTGLILVSYGAGCMLGSVLGGRWSDQTLRRLTSANDGIYLPEMRLIDSTKPAIVFLPLSVVAYAWFAQERIHVASLWIALFFIGFFITWIFSSTAAYLVDANAGRSSSAVAANSCFRGTAAFVITEFAVPLQDALGDGGLYTLWAGLLVLLELVILLVRLRGGRWREAAEKCEKVES